MYRYFKTKILRTREDGNLVEYSIMAHDASDFDEPYDDLTNCRYDRYIVNVIKQYAGETSVVDEYCEMFDAGINKEPPDEMEEWFNMNSSKYANIEEYNVKLLERPRSTEIDPDIKDLIVELNAIGLKTVSSCQGSYSYEEAYPRKPIQTHSILAYILFDQEVSLPKELVEMINAFGHMRASLLDDHYDATIPARWLVEADISKGRWENNKNFPDNFRYILSLWNKVKRNREPVKEETDPVVEETPKPKKSRKRKETNS
jgi:hypothetical protein